MTTLEKIRQLDDNELITIYNGFSRKLLAGVDVSPLEVLENPPGELNENEEFRKLGSGDLENLETTIVPEEIIPAIRLAVEEWATNPDLATAFDSYLNEPRETEMAAGVILTVGVVLVATIIASSVKAEYKDGKFSFSYDSKGSKNTVELVKTLLTGIPETLRNLT